MSDENQVVLVRASVSRPRDSASETAVWRSAPRQRRRRGVANEFPVYAVLPCSDFDRARDWYEQKLGLTPESPETPGHGWYRCANGTWFILTTSPYAGTAQNTAAGFTVQAIESVMRDLTARGVDFLEYDFGEMGKTQDGLMVMGEYKVAWFKDSEGNILELSQVPAASPDS